MFIFIIFYNNLRAQGHIRYISKVIADKLQRVYRFFDFLNEDNLDNQKYLRE